ncbi:uncharacterized protein LOC113291575 [Papaver somniferum]|uniref:uncharacterized protein LOC113291575 n=1 Tax=Papaver somniferum TaxID=3469 RepID=UPI000E6F9CC9|nr:uncharacterized protein LOC113291575 [Papaver somniferum]
MASTSQGNPNSEFEDIINRMNNLMEEPHTYSYDDNDDAQETSFDTHKNVLFKFNSGKEYHLNILNEVLSKAWRPTGAVSITDIGSGYYNAKFQFLCDMETALQGTPWSVKEDLMLLERCKEEFLIEDYDFKYVYFWIHIHGLPLSMMNKEKVFNIIKEIENPYPIDSELASKRGKYAKVRVRLNITKPLPKDMIITLKSKKKITITFRYEKLPRLCFFCGYFGHIMKQCPHLSKKLEEIPNLSPEEFAYKMNDKTYARYNEEIRSFIKQKNPGIIRTAQDLHQVKKSNTNAQGPLISGKMINGSKDAPSQIQLNLAALRMTTSNIGETTNLGYSEKCRQPLTSTATVLKNISLSKDDKVSTSTGNQVMYPEQGKADSHVNYKTNENAAATELYATNTSTTVRPENHSQLQSHDPSKMVDQNSISCEMPSKKITDSESTRNTEGNFASMKSAILPASENGSKAQLIIYPRIPMLKPDKSQLQTISTPFLSSHPNTKPNSNFTQRGEILKSSEADEFSSISVSSTDSTKKKNKCSKRSARINSKGSTEKKDEEISIGVKRHACPMDIDVPIKKTHSTVNSQKGVVAAQNQPQVQC